MTSEQISSIELLDSRISNYLGNRLGWTELTPIQESTIPILKEKNDTLIISPTASGKTEAVLLPIFDDIIRNNLKPMSVLYVSPLKALINDMHDRMERWCNHFYLEVTKWHGDVTGSRKTAFIKQPTDFLLITPESLEVIFMNRSFEQKQNIFKHLKYIIVDEIHYFVESDRGTQLNSLLNRLRSYTNESFTIVGLSATVGNPEIVSKWLNPDIPAKIVNDPSKRPAEYRVKYGSELQILNTLSKHRSRKILIFVHSRKNAEMYHNFLKRNLKLDNIYVHHSSIDKDRREENEEKFKTLKGGFMISTSTLELGIDIGDIDIVIQMGPPHNVSSFLQRIGRSGRRTQNQMSIIFYEGDPEIFIALSEISLIKEGSIEDIKIPDKPKDIYFHQILSAIFENGRMKMKELFYYLKNAYVFSKISKDEFKSILKNMEERDFIDFKGGYLSLGHNFEKKFGKKNFLDFYSVFCPNYEFKVKEGVKNIGTLDMPFAMILKKGNKFVLGGIPWEVRDIDYKRFTIRVKSISARIDDIPQWFSEGGAMDYLISRKIYEILLGNFEEGYLEYFDDSARELIHKYITKAKKSGFKSDIIPVEFDSKEHRIYLYTFAGNKVNALISTIFSLNYEIYSVKDSPYYSSFKYKNSMNINNVNEIFSEINNILKEPDIYALTDLRTKKLIKNKFINYLPDEDQAKLKMDILYNQDDLIHLVNNNSIELIESSEIKNWR